MAIDVMLIFKTLGVALVVGVLVFFGAMVYSMFKEYLTIRSIKNNIQKENKDNLPFDKAFNNYLKTLKGGAIDGGEGNRATRTSEVKVTGTTEPIERTIIEPTRVQSLPNETTEVITRPTEEAGGQRTEAQAGNQHDSRGSRRID